MDRATIVRRALIAFVPLGLLTYEWLAGVALLALLGWSGKSRASPLLNGILALLVTSLLSALNSADVQAALLAAAGLAIGVALMSDFQRLVGNDDIYFVLFGVAVALSANGLVAGAQVLWEGQERASAFAFHPNILGAKSAIATVALLGAMNLSRMTGGQKALLLPGVLSGVVSLAYSGSRGAYLAFIVGLVTMVLLHFWQKKTRRGLLIALGAIVLTASFVLFNEPMRAPLVQRFATLDSVVDGTGRPLLWALSLELISDRPFLGYGFGSFPHAIAQIEPSIRTDRIQHAHNLYIQLLLDGGYLLLAAFSTWLFIQLRQVFVRARQGSYLSLVALSAAAAFLANCLTEPLFYQASLAGLFLLILTLGHLPGSSHGNSPTPLPGPRNRY